MNYEQTLESIVKEQANNIDALLDYVNSQPNDEAKRQVLIKSGQSIMECDSIRKDWSTSQTDYVAPAPARNYDISAKYPCNSYGSPINECKAQEGLS